MPHVNIHNILMTFVKALEVSGEVQSCEVDNYMIDRDNKQIKMTITLKKGMVGCRVSSKH